MSYNKEELYPFVNQDKTEDETDDNTEDSTSDNTSEDSDDRKFVDGDVDTEYERFEVKVLEPGFDRELDLGDLDEEARKEKKYSIEAYLKQQELLEEEEDIEPPTVNLSAAVALTYTIINEFDHYSSLEAAAAVLSGLNKKELGFTLTEKVETNELIDYLGELDESKKKQKLLNNLNKQNRRINQAISHQSTSFVNRENKLRSIIMNNHTQRER